MSNRLVAVLFLSFLLAPVWLADLAVREKFDRVKELGRAYAVIASGAWLPRLLRGVRSIGRVRTLPFRQLRSAAWRGLLFTLEVPAMLLQMAREHAKQPSARSLTKPEMIHVRGVAPPW